METSRSGLSKRSIYPGYGTEYFIDHSTTFAHPFDTDDESLFVHDQNAQNKLEIDLRNIKQHYHQINYKEVVNESMKAIKNYVFGMVQDVYCAVGMLDLGKIKDLVGKAYLYLFKAQGKLNYLLRAKKYLSQDRQIETEYKRSQRYNNLGVCELLLGKTQTAFHYFSLAFEGYKNSGELNLLGILKNIGQVYTKMQMYDEAAKLYDYILQEEDRQNRLKFDEYLYLVIILLECINESGNDVQLRKTAFQRGKQILSKLDIAKEHVYLLRGKIRFQLIRYGIKWGIQQGINEQVIQKWLWEVLGYPYDDIRMKVLKGECCFVYRNIFLRTDQQKYKQYSELAHNFYTATLQRKNS